MAAFINWNQWRDSGCCSWIWIKDSEVLIRNSHKDGADVAGL